MNKIRILVLTDHKNHSAENSVYALLRCLCQHKEVSEVYVASRHYSHNDAFFKDMRTDVVWAKRVDENFAFSSDGNLFNIGLKQQRINSFNGLFLRLPRPITDEFLNFVSDICRNGHTSVINQPEGIIETSSKAFLLGFPELCPPMRLCRTKADILDFVQQFPLVLKPLREYGGKGIVKVLQDGSLTDGSRTLRWEEYMEEVHPKFHTEGVLAMQFLEQVTKGDKRIIVVGGEVMAASLRLPPEGSWLCNVAQGGRSVAAEIEPAEERIISCLAPVLKEKGILICGIDTLVGNDGQRVLSEINTLSIGGFPQAEKQSGRPIIQQTINKIVAYVQQQQ